MKDLLFLIPEYPNKEVLSLKHRELIDFLHSVQPVQHSSSNFVNLFILDVENDTYLSRVDDVLIVEQKELHGSKPTYMLLSVIPPDNAVQKVLDKGISPIVLFPYAITGAQIDNENADHIYDIKLTHTHSGSEYSGFRRKVKLFGSHQSITYTKIDPSDELWDFAEKIYAEATIKNPQQALSLETEQAALEKTLLFYNQLPITIYGLYRAGILVGFTITELIIKKEHSTTNQSTILIHFFRTDNSLKGVGEYLFYELANVYKEQASLINFEQDLGLEGLRRFKESLRPITKQPVYTIDISPKKD